MIEQILEGIAALGLRLWTLHRTENPEGDEHAWQVQLRGDEPFYFCNVYGPTAEGGLQVALDKAQFELKPKDDGSDLF